MTFIEELADTIINQYSDDAKSLVVVLPGRRSGLFLKKALAGRSEKALLLPHILSVEEYVFMQSRLRKMDETAMLTLLYTVYRDFSGDNAFPLDEFLATGKTMLSDFNDVDDYLLSPDEVFTYLYKVREIEGWVPGEADTGLQKKYLSFYALLKPIYHLFTEKLLTMGMGYQGLASRQLSMKTDLLPGCSKVIFAGLNAITPSLSQHINNLLLAGKAELAWDADSWYVNNPDHEAGHFMRLNKITWPGTFAGFPSNFAEIPKSIDIVGAPLGYSQVQTALDLLEEKYSHAFSDTVLVLADEGLLLPLLSSLPSEWANRVNISGGYPVKNTLAGHLLLASLEMFSVSSSGKSDKHTYDIDTLMAFVSSPLLSLLIKKEELNDFAALIDEIRAGQVRYFHWKAEDDEFPGNHLLHRFEQYIPDTMSPCNTWQEFLIRQEERMIRIFEASEENDLEHEACWMMYSMVKSLRHTLAAVASDITPESVLYFIRRQLQVSKIPLKGEPLQGIQILGMLETRSLDFKNVVILGVNEGFLPAAGHTDSFLPYDVRRELGLPLPYEHDAVYSYHFWRLIQRASEVTLIYNTEHDPVFGKEPSRFLAQIEYELLPAFPSVKKSRKVLGISYQSEKVTSGFDVSREVIDRELDRIAEKGLSFSALFTFAECPFQFLHKYIFRVKEWEDRSGDIALNTMGSVFHYAIEHLTEPFLNRLLRPSDLDVMISGVKEHLENALKKYEVLYTASGYNFLVRELLEESLTKMLTNMKATLPGDYYVKATEVDLSTTIELNDHRTVRIHGVADRIECVNGLTRVMDFKTTHNRKGCALDTDKPMIEHLTTKNKYLIQVLFYSWLYANQFRLDEITGGIYLVLNNSNHVPDIITNKKKEPVILNASQLSDFGEMIKGVVEDIFSADQEFKPRVSNETCKYCPYYDVICFENKFATSDDGEQND